MIMMTTHLKQRGLTLVELMVGAAISLFIVAVILTVFSGSRTIFKVNTNLARESEGARMVIGLMREDVRQAAFAGCRYDNQAVPAGQPPNGAAKSVMTPLAGFLDGGMLGAVPGYMGHAEQGGGVFLPALPANIAPATGSTFASNSDVLSIRLPADPNAQLLTTATVANSPLPVQLAANLASNNIAVNDVVLITNCKNSEYFRVTAETAPQASGQLSHRLAGNASANLVNAYDTMGTAVYKLQTRHYFVATSLVPPGGNALWRHTVPAPAGTTQPEDWLSGIDGLAVFYGVDVNPIAQLSSAGRYARANAMTANDWPNVKSVRLEVLSSTVQSGVATGQQAPLQFGGQTLTFTDSRLHMVTDSIVGLRMVTP